MKFFDKLELWKKEKEKELFDLDNQVLVDMGWLQTALKHYCGSCKRWFGDTRGLLMHNRHNHKKSIL